MTINAINYLNNLHLDGEAIILCGVLLLGYLACKTCEFIRRRA